MSTTTSTSKFISSQHSQVQHRGEHTTLKLADFGLACSFKKGPHSCKSGNVSKSRGDLRRESGVLDNVSEAEFRCWILKRLKRAKAKVSCICSEGRPLKDILGTPCYVAPEAWGVGRVLCSGAMHIGFQIPRVAVACTLTATVAKCCKKHEGAAILTWHATVMPPEVLNARYDERCDVWSVGVVSFVLCTGHGHSYRSHPQPLV